MKRPFTLLELLVGFTLLLLVGGLIGWRGRDAIVKKRFETDFASFKQTCEVCQRIAVATQSDWRGILRKEGSNWVFETTCIDHKAMRPLKPVSLHGISMLFNRGTLSDGWTLEFFASGKVSPEGTLLFTQGPKEKELTFPDLFGNRERAEVKESGPIHPHSNSHAP